MNELDEAKRNSITAIIEKACDKFLERPFPFISESEPIPDPNKISKIKLELLKAIFAELLVSVQIFRKDEDWGKLEKKMKTKYGFVEHLGDVFVFFASRNQPRFTQQVQDLIIRGRQFTGAKISSKNLALYKDILVTASIKYDDDDSINWKFIINKVARNQQMEPDKLYSRFMKLKKDKKIKNLADLRNFLSTQRE